MFFNHRDFEGIMLSGGIAPRILNLGTRLEDVLSVTTPQKSLLLPLDRKLIGLTASPEKRCIFVFVGYRILIPFVLLLENKLK